MAVSSPELLAALKPALADLAADLLERARDESVGAALRALWRRERDAQRTADDYEIWSRERVKQVAAAWVLSLVFVRTLEDRGLLERRRLAGDGARDSEELFVQLAPFLSARDYLLTVFRELSGLEGARHVFDPRRNPVWTLGPSAEAARRLLENFRATDEHGGLRLELSGADTRFLGDLYQDLDDEIRDRYALLQTPDFVEDLILDETLDPAIREFGVEEIRLIDPACGSGHFLLGAYRRLLEAWRKARPAADARELALNALEQVHGVDLNPYAVSITRFRLTLAYLEAAGHLRLRGAPPLPIKVAVADSLDYWRRLDLYDDERDRDPFELVDSGLAADILRVGTYHVVVGNPPYINVKDAALRDAYRDHYTACHRGYQLVAPFLERFFQLALREETLPRGGYVGAIVGNGFMKREFGKKLIEEVLPNQELTHVIDTSGAYIPGHGTPTVILIGRQWANPQRPSADPVLAVMGKRGEPTTPEDPSQGQVWSAIRDHRHEIGYEDEYISVAEVERERFRKHPWSLGGGGAAELKVQLEEKADRTLSEVAEEIGFVCITRADDVYFAPPGSLQRAGIRPEHITFNVEGDRVRDWSISEPNETVFPYDADLEPLHIEQERPVHRFLWPYREILWRRREPNGDHRELGRTWWEWSRFQRARFRNPFSIAFAEVATHNHFVFDRAARVFNRTAPVIKLGLDTTKDGYFALLGYLNSSTACFWLKQVSHDKGSGTDTGKWQDDPAKIAFVFAGTRLGGLPLFPLEEQTRERLRALASLLDELGRERAALLDEVIQSGSRMGYATSEELRSAIATARARDDRLLEQSIAAQEEIDWIVYGAAGLADESLAGHGAEPLRVPLGCRPFEVRAARQGWVIGTDGQPLLPRLPPEWTQQARDLWEARIAVIDAEPAIALVEAPEYKRRWAITPKYLAGKVLTFDHRLQSRLQTWLADYVENHVRETASGSPRTVSLLATALASDARFGAVAEVATGDASPNIEALLTTLARDYSVPYLAAHRYTDSGQEKRQVWERAWDLQRRDDEGDRVDVPVPPKYSKGDFRSETFFDLRGKLDVPKERFISYPGAETDEDPSPVIGWAGWDHLQQAQALADLFNRRRRDEGWGADRLTPLLAGLLELVPWLRQWHNDPDPRYGGQCVGDMYAAFVEERARELNLTLDDLRAWRPPASTRGRRAASPRAAASDGGRRGRSPAVEPDRLLELVVELDDGAGVEQAALADHLGVTPQTVARAAQPLLDEGRLVLTSGRPKRFQVSGEGM